MDWLLNNYIEISGALLGIAYVILALRQSLWCWYFGFANVGMYVYIFFNENLYGESALNFIYLIMSVYGWYQWKFKKNTKQSTDIVKISKKISLNLLIIAVVSSLVFGLFLENYTPSPIPYWDGLTTALGILATWMTAKKILENWLVWIFANSISIGIYYYKLMYPTMILYLVLSIIALMAYYKWKTEVLQLKTQLK